MTDYEAMTTEEMANKFLEISRQRIHQLVSKFSKRNNTEMLRKIRDAKLRAKQLRKASKHLISEISTSSQISP